MSSVPADYIPGFVCSLDTCNITEWGYVHYQPTLPGNILFLVIIDALALAQLILGIYYKTGLFCTSMLFGLASECSGYIARILLHSDPFSRVYFLWYLICLTIGPVFIAAAIYLCLGRIVVVYGEEISRIKPRSYTLFFLGCDCVSLVVQAVGGGIAASAPVTNQSMIDLGTHILVAGLSFQVASLFAFSTCSLEYLWRVSKQKDILNPKFTELHHSKRFKLFQISLFLATACLFARTVFRSVELSGGFSGPLANNEVEFMILDGVMVLLACISLTLMHPGYGFEGRWRETRFPFRYTKPKGDQEIAPEIAASSSSSGEKINSDASVTVARGSLGNGEMMVPQS